MPTLADTGGLLQASTKGEVVLFLRCFTTCTDNVRAMKDFRGAIYPVSLYVCRGTTGVKTSFTVCLGGSQGANAGTVRTHQQH